MPRHADRTEGWPRAKGGGAAVRVKRRGGAVRDSVGNREHGRSRYVGFNEFLKDRKNAVLHGRD